jgi:arsenite-transporting ATPase
MARRRRDPDPYDVVVVDTAPTGHTLRLLAAPETVAAMAGVLDALQEDHRFIRERIAGSLRAEDADRLIALIAQQAADVGSMLRDPRRASFHWVTLPERLSVAKAADGIAALTAAGIAVGHIDVNRVLPDDDPCLLCDRRRREERQVLAAIRRGIGRGRRVGVVPAQATEPRGIAALERLASAASPLSAVRPNRSGSRAGSAAATVRPPVRGRSPIGEALSGAALVFVGGKGGVGKTTVAASIALTLARAASRRSVLLLSTDPAHSLADVLDAPVGDDAAPVRGAPPNLVVRELDAPRALASKRASLQTALDETGVSLGGSSVRADPLIELAPPGIAELFGMLSVVDALAAHHTVVIDTAPTGHALRLLEMPDAAREWVQLLLRVLLKYKSLVRPGRLARELVEASQSIRALQSIMRDPVRTRFVVVTRAAAVTRAETGRLFLRLRALGLTTRAVVVNAMTMAPGRCRRCTATAAAERRELTALKALARKARLRDCAIIQTPLVAPPPRGPAALSAWPRTWVASEP